MNELRQADSVYDTSYLTAVGASSAKSSTTWNVTVAVNGRQLPIKLDTGAEVTVISEEASRLLSRRELQSSLKGLRGPDNRSLEVVGELTASLAYKDCASEETVYVVRNIHQNLLGLPAIQSLCILPRVKSLETFTVEQNKVFEGLDTFPETFTICLSGDAKPFDLFTPRNVPIPLRKKVEKELTRIESLGVISRSTKLSSWCAGMVAIRRCLHLC